MEILGGLIATALWLAATSIPIIIFIASAKWAFNYLF